MLHRLHVVPLKQSDSLESTYQIYDFQPIQTRDDRIRHYSHNTVIIGNYQTSVYYMDIVSEFEKMGDFMINISQALQKFN